MATFIKGDKIKPLVVLEEDVVEQEVDGITAFGIPKDKYPNLCEYLYTSIGGIILTRQLGDQDGESGMYSAVYHYPYPQEEGEPSDKMLTYYISYTIMGVSDDGNYYLCVPAITNTFVTESNDEQLSSIELSRAATYEGYELSEDIKNNFKQNIGISGGADWNAQQGEAGYIKNKPFERKNIEPSISNNEVVYQGIDTEDVYIQCYDSLYTFPYAYDEDSSFFIETEKEIYIVQDDVSIKALRSEYEIRVQNLTNELDVNYITNFITVFYVKRKLNQSDIDDTVLKTIPQTLSDDDKNQALANLGIDPVVWKYICNPYVFNGVNFSSGTKIPSELMENGKLKYKIPAMYRIHVDNNYYDIDSLEPVDFTNIDNLYGEYTPVSVHSSGLRTTSLYGEYAVSIYLSPDGGDRWCIEVIKVEV